MNCLFFIYLWELPNFLLFIFKTFVHSKYIKLLILNKSIHLGDFRSKCFNDYACASTISKLKYHVSLNSVFSNEK